MTRWLIIRNGLLTGCIVCALGLFAVAAGSKFNRVVEVGVKGPDFEGLIGTDGKRHSLADYQTSKLVVLVFIRNHCPVAKLYLDRLREFSKKFKSQGVRLISLNVSLEPNETLDKMLQFWHENRLEFEYLRDDSQKVGRAYGATNTPHVFVLDQNRKIAYMGAIDDSNAVDEVTESYLVDAVTALLSGKPVDITETLQRGCEIIYQGE